MQIGGKHVNPYLYRYGGRIVGDYMFLNDKKIRMTNSADIELAAWALYCPGAGPSVRGASLCCRDLEAKAADGPDFSFVVALLNAPVFA